MENNSVKLISITPEPEKMLGFTARASAPQNQLKHWTTPRLLGYCIKNRHWSIFEMVNMCLEIETSRAISAQILRHRSFSFQEFSQRYAQVQEILEYPARRQDNKNRQNSIDDMSEEDKQWWIGAQKQVAEHSQEVYNDAINRGVAKEQARMVLPMASKTRLYMNGNVRSWIHYIDLRQGNGTQLEHRDIALKCKDIFIEQLPSIAEALEWK